MPQVVQRRCDRSLAVVKPRHEARSSSRNLQPRLRTKRGERAHERFDAGLRVAALHFGDPRLARADRLGERGLRHPRCRTLLPHRGGKLETELDDRLFGFAQTQKLSHLRAGDHSYFRGGIRAL